MPPWFDSADERRADIIASGMVEAPYTDRQGGIGPVHLIQCVRCATGLAQQSLFTRSTAIHVCATWVRHEDRGHEKLGTPSPGRGCRPRYTRTDAACPLTRNRTHRRLLRMRRTHRLPGPQPTYRRS